MNTHTERRDRFEALWDGHYRAVLAYAMRRTDSEEARDIAAEAFTAAWRRLDDVPADPRPWLLGLARGALANSRRSSRRRIALAERVADRLRTTAETREEHGLAEAMARLLERDVEALLLVAWEGLSHADAARVTGCTTGTFAVRIHRARRRLERELSNVAGPVTTIEERA